MFLHGRWVTEQADDVDVGHEPSHGWVSAALIESIRVQRINGLSRGARGGNPYSDWGLPRGKVEIVPQLLPPPEASAKEHAEAYSQADPNRVVRESEEYGPDSGAKDQAYSGGDGPSRPAVLFIGHVVNLSDPETCSVA